MFHRVNLHRPASGFRRGGFRGVLVLGGGDGGGGGGVGGGGGGRVRRERWCACVQVRVVAPSTRNDEEIVYPKPKTQNPKPGTQ